MDAEDWDERYSTTDLVWTAEANRTLVTEVGSLTPGTALDVAAGEGRNAVWLAARGWQVTATDFSAVGLAKARDLAENAGVSIRTICIDATEPVDGRFDLVVVAYLHLPPDARRAAVRNAAGALAEGGTLLVIGHDSDNLTQGVGGPQDPDVLFRAADIVGDLAGLGLNVERAERIERTVHTDHGDRTALDALVRARRPGSDDRLP